MSVENQQLRDTLAELALKKIGRTARNPFYRFGQLSASDYQAVIGKLPYLDPPEIQIMSGANIGKFYFLADFDTPDDTNVVVA